MFSKLYSLLVSFLGESKQGSYDKHNYQYQFNCPCCAEENYGEPDNKYNLEVNLLIGKFQCWKCSEVYGTKGNLSHLVKKYGGAEVYQSYKEEIDSLRRTKLYDIDLYSGVTISNFEPEQIRLPKTFTNIDLKHCENKELVNFLSKRKIDQSIINRLNIGYTTDKEKDASLRNRMIIPSYDAFGDLNFWVGRDYTDKHFAKYKNCIGNKKEIIFQESKIDWDNDIVLVEGAIDCIYYPNTISLLGKTLNKDSYLYSTLIKKSNANIIICLDNDTRIEETKRIYSLLNIGRLTNKILYIRLNKIKDFGELYEKYGKQGFIKALKSAKNFEEIDLII